MKGGLRFFCLLAAVPLLAAMLPAACASGPDPSGGRDATINYTDWPSLILSEGDNGKTATTMAGSGVHASLPIDPKTAYRWEISSVSQMAPMPANATVEPPARTTTALMPDAHGGPNILYNARQDLALPAGAPGNFTAQLIYAQPGQTNPVPAAKWSVTYRVYPQPVIKLAAADEGKTVPLTVGDVVSVVLFGTWGQGWQGDEQSLGGMKIVATSFGSSTRNMNYVSPDPGWPARYTLNLSAEQPGTFNVKLNCVPRPVRGPVARTAPMATWSVTFVVGPKPPG